MSRAYTRDELEALDTAELRHVAERDFDLDWVELRTPRRREAITEILYIQEQES